MMNKDEHWLDKIIEDQRRTNGDLVTSMIAKAVRATEVYTEDELEDFAHVEKRKV